MPRISDRGGVCRRGTARNRSSQVQGQLEEPPRGAVDAEMDFARTGPNWRVSRTAPSGWNALDFDDKNWEYARVIADYGSGPWGSLQDDERYVVPYCAGIPGRLRVMYLPKRQQVNLNNLERGVMYEATWVDPSTGRRMATQYHHQRPERASSADRERQ